MGEKARMPNVNARDVIINANKEVVLEDPSHNPSDDSLLITGFERSIEEYSKIGASFLRKEKRQ